jgi:hypothetical protein
MEKKIVIKSGSLEILAELNDSKTAELVWNALPISSKVNTWGDEIYFSIPVKTGEENGVEVVEIGDIGYWPPGNAFCIFFGRTPVSTPDEIRPASAVNLIGKVIGDPKVLKKIKSGENIIIEQIKK